MDSSSSDDDEQDEDESMKMVAVHEETECAEEHVLHYMGSTSRHRVFNWRRRMGAC